MDGVVSEKGKKGDDGVRKNNNCVRKERKKNVHWGLGGITRKSHEEEEGM